MKQFLTQFNKEFRANFNGFSAYIIIAAYYILSLFSALYLGDYFLRESEIMNAYFIMQPVILTLVIPATTMRTWANPAHRLFQTCACQIFCRIRLFLPDGGNVIIFIFCFRQAFYP